MAQFSPVEPFCWTLWRNHLNQILFESVEGIGLITLNRPEKLNSFGGTMREELLAALTRAAEDPAVRVVTITGAGRAFCAGGDLAYMQELQKENRTADLQKLLEAGARIVTAIRTMPKFVLASINGVAAGAGCNLALACDYRIAARAATFAQSFVRIGLHPDWGGTFFLPRLVGPSRAMEMMITGRPVDAEEALAMGLVDRVVDDGALLEQTTKLARAAAAGPPIAISAIKAAIQQSGRNSLDEQLALESRHQLKAFDSADSREGITAFFEKRPPKFDGS